MEDNLRDAYGYIFSETSENIDIDGDQPMEAAPETKPDLSKLNEVIVDRCQEILSQWYSICVCASLSRMPLTNNR